MVEEDNIIQLKDDSYREKIFEFIWQTLNGQIPIENQVSSILDLKSQHKQFDTIISDIISIIDVEISLTTDQELKERFNALIQIIRQVIGDDILKERLEIETLEHMKLINKKENFNQKYIKIKTRLFYKQQKFNLLREESEGYSKLIAELNQKSLHENVLQNIQSLIGCFNLDPNRVLDVILESFENNLANYESFVKLLQDCRSENETICNIIGFKFQSLNNDNSIKVNQQNQNLDTLYRVAAYLLKYELIDLSALEVHLYPNDEGLTELFKEDFEAVRQHVKKMNSLNLNSNLESSKPENVNGNQNDDELELKQKKHENQKISLIKCLIEIEDWRTSLKLLEKLPQWYLATYEDVTQSICNVLNRIIDPLYSQCNIFSKELKRKLFNQSEGTLNESFFDAFNNYALPILRAIGPGVSHDPILFTKLVRIFIAFMEQKQNNQTLLQIPLIETFYNNIFTVINEVLLPSLSMMSMNPCLAIELWNLIKQFPYEMRYCLYNSWRAKTYTSYPQLIKVKAECEESIKYLLKRLTKENVKIQGRQIGKLSHNNPIIICDYILTQIQRYDNFINPIVDSLKFMTPLSYDVLSYCIIMSISDPDKEKMKHDSTNISSWLQSVASFCALVFKKYQIELTAIIQYVINQLKNRKSFDLLILQEIIQKMCGIEISSEATDLQLDAMTGGDLLRQEAGFFNQIRNTKKSSNRLKEALADHNLILPLCILLSQERDYIVFADRDENRHLKLTGSLYDQCQDSLVQFSQFLSTTLTTEEYIHIFPKIDELVSMYHMSADVAFFLSRPMYIHHIQSKYDELRKVDRITKSAEKPSKTQRYLEAIDLVMQPVIDLVKTLQPAKIWEDISPLFYTTFWTLSCNDLAVPTMAYDRQRNSLKQKLNSLDENVDLPQTKKKKEKEKLDGLMVKLVEEENKQKDHVAHVKARLDREKENWFPQKNKTKNETITEFLQLCIFSRCLFTQIDAIYCAKFIQTIHSLKTPNFSTIICYDRIFSDISYSIASLTDNEARRYGRFLLGLLETVMYWHSDNDVFERECLQYPGFLTVFRNSLNSSNTAANKQEQLDYENFRHVCHKWHYKLTKSFIVCLESDEYLQMRNALIILTKILPHYPKLTGFCSALDKRVEKIKQSEKDKRQDIYTLASVYLGQLRLRKPHMLEESKFHLKEVPKEKQKSTSTNGGMSQQILNSETTKKSITNFNTAVVNTPSNTQDDKSKVSKVMATSNGASQHTIKTQTPSSNTIHVDQTKLVSTASNYVSSNVPNITSSNNKTQTGTSSTTQTGVAQNITKSHHSSENQKNSKQTEFTAVSKNLKSNNESTISTIQPTSKSNSSSINSRSITVNSKNTNIPLNSSESTQRSANGKSKKQNEASEFSITGEDSIGSITSDDLSPKRTRKSSSRSSSPQNYKNIDRSKRIKTEDNLKGSYGAASHISSDKQKSTRDHDKDKKEHRKRDHSSDANDPNNQKRSRSDEKKKSSPSSKRSSKKIENKDDLATLLASNTNNNNKSSREIDNRRSPREKSSYSTKEKK